MVNIKVNTISHTTTDSAIELQCAINMKNLSSDPSTSDSSAGDVYFNTTTNKLKFYSGTSWLEFGTT